jgi:hypothetical protein
MYRVSGPPRRSPEACALACALNGRTTAGNHPATSKGAMISDRDTHVIEVTLFSATFKFPSPDSHGRTLTERADRLLPDRSPTRWIAPVRGGLTRLPIRPSAGRQSVEIPGWLASPILLGAPSMEQPRAPRARPWGS